MLSVNGNVVTVTTKTLTAIFDCGVLLSLKAKDGTEYLENVSAEKGDALELVYMNNEVVPVKKGSVSEIRTIQLSPTRAAVRFDSWDANGTILIGEDEATGEVTVEPEAFSSRSGVMSCRFVINNIASRLKIVAPLYQGIRMDCNDPLLRNGRFIWPISWEAGMCIFEGDNGGFWVHTQDSRYIYKALVTGYKENGMSVAFDTDAYGPLDNNLSAGGLIWRINVFNGDYKVPASEYKNWLWKTYNLEKAESERPDWLHEIGAAVSWCPTKLDVLEALSKRANAKKILLHVPNWRNYIYDQNYPDFTPSKEACEFISKAVELGFKVLPHANIVDMDPSMPHYQYLQDFKYIHHQSKKLLGWGWSDGRVLGVPDSNKALLNNRDKNVMIKVHPGLALWRAMLAECIKDSLDKLGNITKAVFTDVTLCSHNLHNCLVDNTTSTEGMKMIIREIASINGGIAVGGEGLNEITMQELTVAQAHLFNSHQTTHEALSRTGKCDLNNFMFGKICRTFGYSGLSGRNEDEELRMRIHEEHGAIPTITISSAEQILNPNRAVKSVLERTL